MVRANRLLKTPAKWSDCKNNDPVAIHEIQGFFPINPGSYQNENNKFPQNI